jgi:hypothetical protein
VTIASVARPEPFITVSGRGELPGSVPGASRPDHLEHLDQRVLRRLSNCAEQGDIVQFPRENHRRAAPITAIWQSDVSVVIAGRGLQSQFRVAGLIEISLDDGEGLTDTVWKRTHSRNASCHHPHGGR